MLVLISKIVEFFTWGNVCDFLKAEVRHIVLSRLEREKPQVVKNMYLQISALVQPPHEISILLHGKKVAV